MFVVATAGHVDHGKSTLVRALTGEEPDRWDEERRRGLTIDLGFASAALPDGQVVAFVDVPGHQRFVPNMLAGIGSVPAVMFVVAADDGWMPQSQEHLDALVAAGVRDGILVVSRTDLIGPEMALDEARTALARTPLADMPAVAVSARTGDGVDELRSALMRLGTSLPTPDPRADVRLWVDRSFTIGGAGTVVTGTLGAGTVRVGDGLTVGASGRTVTVRGVQSLGRDVQRMSAMARVALNLRGVPADEVTRGAALLTPGRWRGAAQVDVRVAAAVEGFPEQMVAHCGSAATAVHVRPLWGSAHSQGVVCWARLTLAEQLPLRVGDRLILRDPGAHRIPAGVVVLDPAPPELRRRGDGRRRADVLADVPDMPSLASELSRRGYAHADDLRAWGVRDVPDSAENGGWLLDGEAASCYAARLAEFVRDDARRNPLARGVPEEAARKQLGLPDARLLPVVLERPEARALAVADGRIRPAGAGSALPAAVEGAADRLQERLRADPFAAPPAAELSELGLGKRELAACARAGMFTEIGPGVWLGADAVEEAVEALRDLPQPFTPSEARTRLGSSRRVVMPLLELLARRGLTRRDGDDGHVIV
ncbi:MAG: selenocysteine-specific translation elongation factor [Tomitella sp.]|nr:selenocysteine-specific translation elongation factor [Tomitella sp.]